MEYDSNYWSSYTSKNNFCNEELAKFIRDLVTSLKVKSVLEVGCNTGNELKAFSETFDVHGVDANEGSLEKARKNLPSVEFKKSFITKLPYDDASIDFVFTHKVLNFIADEEIPIAMNELYRVSKKYILNLELFKESEGVINDNDIFSWYRNMYKRWLDFSVKIISNVEMHEDIDPEKTRFVLVRKI